MSELIKYGRIKKVEPQFAIIETTDSKGSVNFANTEDSICIPNLQKRYSVGQSVVLVGSESRRGGGFLAHIVCPSSALREGVGRVEGIGAHFGVARADDDRTISVYFAVARLARYAAFGAPTLDAREVLKIGDKVRFTAVPQSGSVRLKAIEIAIPGRAVLRPAPKTRAAAPSVAERNTELSPPLTTKSASVASDESELENELSWTNDAADALCAADTAGSNSPSGSSLSSEVQRRTVVVAAEPARRGRNRPCAKKRQRRRLAELSAVAPEIERVEKATAEVVEPLRQLPLAMDESAAAAQSEGADLLRLQLPPVPPRLIAAAAEAATALERQCAQLHLSSRPQSVASAGEAAMEVPPGFEGPDDRLRGREDKSAQTAPSLLQDDDALIGQLRQLVVDQQLSSAYINYRYPHLGYVLFPP